MNYEFELEQWMPKFPLTDVHGNYSGEDVTSPCDLCNNEWLRRGMQDHYDWGTPVPVDIFVHALGEPENRYATKIGGLPYWPLDEPWPKTESGRSMGLIAQFNFTNSEDIVGDLPGDLLLVFGDDSEGWVEPLYLEWQIIGNEELVTELPGDQMVIRPSFGYRQRTLSYPDAIPLARSTPYPQCDGRDVWSDYYLLQYQATQIGRAPFFIQHGVGEELDAEPLCTVASVQPDAHKTYPWINHPDPLCSEDEWPDGSDDLMFGDLGCLYIFIDDDEELYFDQSCY